MSATEIITASVTVLTTLGGGIAFVWNKIEKRFSEIETKLEECQARERESKQRELESQKRRSVQLTAIELLWQEVQRIAPDSMVLVRAKKLLDDLKIRNDEEVFVD